MRAYGVPQRCSNEYHVQSSRRSTRGNGPAKPGKGGLYRPSFHSSIMKRKTRRAYKKNERRKAKVHL